LTEASPSKSGRLGRVRTGRRRRPRLEGFKREILNAPNLITVGRILMIPPILLLVDKTDPFKGFLAMALFLIAGGLDVLDGWLARRQGLETFFGKFADPLADKIMVMALLVYLTAEGRMPAWLVAILLGREFYISGLRTLAINEEIEIGAGAGGKAKTSFQVIGIACVLIYFPYRAPWGGWVDFYDVGLLLLYVSAVLSIWSAVTYTQDFIAALAGQTEEVADDEHGPGT
jgi:CDP-diacylglycerol--glycerol-3-phosphate 3-phosphatidyltransferase